MGLFDRSAPSLLGVDISSTSVKILELRRDAQGFCVDSYAVEPLPPKAVTDKVIEDVSQVGECLKKAIKRAGTKTKNCALAVTGSAVITKMITMPASLEDEDMEAQIQLDADQYIPFSLEEVNLDFNVLGPSKSNSAAVDVLIAASRSENVESRAAVAELAGLTAKIVDVEPYCVETVFSYFSDMLSHGEDGLTAVIDMGASMTSLSVLRGGKLIYTREQSFGGRELTEEIMSRYNLNYQDAGLAKKEGGLPEDYEAELLEPFKEGMVQQVSRFLQLFYSASDYTHVDQIVLAGGCACIGGIDEMVETRMAVPTSIVSPFSNMKIASRINSARLLNDAPALLIACGLALRSFD